MTKKNVLREILKLGGVVTRDFDDKITATCNGYDIEWSGNDFMTVRLISKRGHYDQGSDYNPGGYHFVNKIKSLAAFIDLK